MLSATLLVALAIAIVATGILVVTSAIALGIVLWKLAVHLFNGDEHV